LAHRPDDQEALHFLNTLIPEEEAPLEEPQPAVEEIRAKAEQQDLGEEAPAAQEELPEIATPTLAEIYLEQGQIEEAIETYETIVAQNPEDESSKDRLGELKAMIAGESSAEKKELDEVRQKKEKMIAILESWLANIREQFNTA
jgi:tetratricopeptide (TPR) repeat protein